MPTSKREMTQQIFLLHQPQVTTFRTCVGVLMYLAIDVPQVQHVIRHLATYSSKPTEKSLAVLRHLVGYLCNHVDVCVSLKWGGQATGIFHDYPNVDANEHVLEVFTVSDWASARVSKRSVSCCIVMFGRRFIYSESRTQKIISLSSAEAEVYPCSRGTSDAILLARLLTWITNKRTHIYIYTDSSGAKGILNRKGGWTFEALELPHLVVAGYGWEWNAEVMQHQRPFESR